MKYLISYHESLRNSSRLSGDDIYNLDVMVDCLIEVFDSYRIREYVSTTDNLAYKWNIWDVNYIWSVYPRGYHYLMGPSNEILGTYGFDSEGKRLYLHDTSDMVGIIVDGVPIEVFDSLYNSLSSRRDLINSRLRDGYCVDIWFDDEVYDENSDQVGRIVMYLCPREEYMEISEGLVEDGEDVRTINLISDLFVEYADKWRLREVHDDCYDGGVDTYYIYPDVWVGGLYHINFCFFTDNLIRDDNNFFGLASDFLDDLNIFCHRLRSYSLEVDMGIRFGQMLVINIKKSV